MQVFGKLLKRFEDFRGDKDLESEVKMNMEKMENDFQALNVEIQKTRMENETVLDQMRQREYKLKKLDKDIKEKATLIQMIEKKMAELKKSK